MCLKHDMNMRVSIESAYSSVAGLCLQVWHGKVQGIFVGFLVGPLSNHTEQ